MLGEEVGWVAVASHLPKLDSSGTHLLLDPQGLAGKVPKLAQPLSSADADRGRRIRPDSNRDRHPEVRVERLLTKAHAGALDDPVELGLARRQGKAGLGRRPAFQHVLAEEETTSRRALPGADAPGPVRVGVHFKLGRLLIRILPHLTWSLSKVSCEALQRTLG